MSSCRYSKIKAETFGLALYGGGVSMHNGGSFTHFTEKEGLSDNRRQVDTRR